MVHTNLNELPAVTTLAWVRIVVRRTSYLGEKVVNENEYLSAIVQNMDSGSVGI